MRQVGEFFQNVWEVVRQVPFGRVTTYGAIAEYLGSKMSARMVGWALNVCPPDVPAHRVVNRIGLLTGKQHFLEHDSMEIALASEGVQVTDNQVKEFKRLFWNPRSLDDTISLPRVENAP